MSFGNRVMNGLLNSPFHFLISGSTMVVQLKGRRSGKLVTTPVNYLQEGQVLWVTSLRGRTWWKNARGGVQGMILLRKNWRKVNVQVIEEPSAVRSAFIHYFQLSPGLAKMYRIRSDHSGQLDSSDLENCVQTRVMIQFGLLD